jgi:hypothetical protein
MIDVGKRGMKCYGCTIRVERRCWNRVVINIDRLVEQVIGLLVKVLESAPGAKDALVERLGSRLAELRCSGDDDVKMHRQRAEKLAMRCRKLVAAISDVQVDDENGEDGLNADETIIAQQINRLEAERQAELRLLHAAELARQDTTSLPVDAATISNDLHGLLVRMATSSFEVADLLRQVITELKVIPIQAVDSGQVHPRVEVVFDLAAWSGMASDPQRFVHDCFPEAIHFVHRKAVVATRDRLRAEGKKASLAKIGDALGIGRMTVRRALQLDSRMRELGLDEPYQVLTESPAAASRWRNVTDREDQCDVAANEGIAA